jgi:hypothetical protein
MSKWNRRRCLWTLAFVLLLSGRSAASGLADPFSSFDLPDDWERKFWDTPGLKALLDLDPKALAAKVPEQAGLRFCRCPNCDAPEATDPLRWVLEKPDVLTCHACKAVVPNDKTPAKPDSKIPEESVEVLPRLYHKYPYHAVEAEKQVYPDERLYLAAKRDYECREFLAKAALYAAVRYRKQPAGQKDSKLARFASVLVLRFAHVYPHYAVHYDQVGEPKFFQPADLRPPYRRDYQSAKWDWSGSMNVPMNLVIAYAILRHDAAVLEAAKALGDSHPQRTVERDFFRASAEFVRLQPEEYSESSLVGYRGMLAVGRLLDDATLVLEAEHRLEEFVRRGFYHDGLWRRGDVRAHRRILDQIDGWFGRLLPSNELAKTDASLALARAAESAVLTSPRSPEILRAAWPAPSPRPSERHAAMLGGSGIIRLAVGQGADALDLELRGLGDLGGLAHTDRLALRLSVAGRPVLGDLDDSPPCPDGWDRSTVSHNVVVVDGQNQREVPEKARLPVPGSDILFFAADPDFQVATMEDRYAYPTGTARYRHTVIASSSSHARYAIGVFEVVGGLQHDQIFHAAVGQLGEWRTATLSLPPPKSFLPSSITYLSNSRAEDGRWFVQSFGAFEPLAQAWLDRASQVVLDDGGPGLRLHLLSEIPQPISLISANVPNSSDSADPDATSRAALVLRRRSSEGASLRTTFVTVFEPIGRGITPLKRVGRLVAAPETIVLMIETVDGLEQILINLTPGTARSVPLVDGLTLSTDGLAARVSASGLVFAGGTFAEANGRRILQNRAAGTVRRSGRGGPPGSRGWFETDTHLIDAPTLVGRACLIRHGDGSLRGWTINHIENLPTGGSRIYVREEPGFTIEPNSGEARYYQFPMIKMRGPHQFVISKISRG